RGFISRLQQQQQQAQQQAQQQQQQQQVGSPGSGNVGKGSPSPGNSSSPGTVTTSNKTQTEPKPVECNLCHRKFKNIPALNGHMRLHGGYFKKDAENKKSEKKEVVGPPLQTASVSVRALIEEKIIQKRTTGAVTATTSLFRLESRRIHECDSAVIYGCVSRIDCVSPVPPLYGGTVYGLPKNRDLRSEHARIFLALSTLSRCTADDASGMRVAPCVVWLSVMQRRWRTFLTKGWREEEDERERMKH
ncbi:hypothetical protein ALC56_04562, partial [Trachymyrmex septentrionalis]